MKRLKKIGMFGLLSLGAIFCGTKNVLAQTNITSEKDLQSCFTNTLENECVLGQDISMNSTLKLEGQDKILDLNGYKLETKKSIEVKSVKLTINDSKETGKYECSKDYGIFAYDNGTIIVNGGELKSLYSVLTGNNTMGDMNFEVNGGTLTSEYGATIYMPGQVNLKITDGILNGGINIRMGQVSISGGTINNTNIANTDTIEEYYNYGGNVFYGDAIAISAGTYTSDNETYGNSLNLNISGGTINSTIGKALNVYSLGKVSQNVNINISGGTFNGLDSSLNVRDMTKESIKDEFKSLSNKINIKVTGGTFNHSIKDYLDSNYVEESTSNGYVAKVNTILDLVNDKGEKLADFKSEKPLPNNYKLQVTKNNFDNTIKNNITNDVSTKLKQLYEENINVKDTKLLDVYDISVLDNSNIVTINGNDNYTISLKADQSLTNLYKYYKVIYIDNNTVKEVISANLVDGYIIFNTKHLSEYGIVGYNTEEVIETPKVENIENPQTFDSITLNVLFGIISVLGLLVTKLYIKRNN